MFQNSQNQQNTASAEDFSASVLVPEIAMRIKADAYAVLANAIRASKMILDRRNAMDRNGQQNTPLVVLAGEDHSKPAHAAHHMKLLDLLSASGSRVAVTLEQSHNQTTNTAAEIFPLLLKKIGFNDTGFSNGETFTHRLIEQWKKQEKQDKQLPLKTMLMEYTPNWCAPHSTFSLYNYLLSRNLPVAHVDASILIDEKDFVIDHKDPTTSDSFKASQRGEPWEGLLASGSGGIRVRNHHMVRMGIDFAKAQNAGILVAFCGAAHVIGMKDGYESVRAEDSLMVEFSCQSGWPVMGVIPEIDDVLGGNDHMNDIMHCELSMVRALYNSGASFPRPFVLPDRKAEAEYLERLLPTLGLSDHVISLNQYNALKNEFTSEIMNTALEIITNEIKLYTLRIKCELHKRQAEMTGDRRSENSAQSLTLT